MSAISVAPQKRWSAKLNQTIIMEFTVVELLTVLLIIGILAAIAIPTYLSVRNNALHSAAVTHSSTVHSDWVRVFKDDYVFKRCDGITLLYRNRDSISAVPNSPECR